VAAGRRGWEARVARGILLAALAGCVSVGSGGGWPATAPAHETVGGVGYTLEVEAWRSFQPLVGERGDPLLAIVRLVADGDLPPDATLGDVRLQRGRDNWEGTLREESPRVAGSRQVDFMLRDGPRWNAGDSIQVMVRLQVGGGSPVVLGVRTAIARVE
jgi:hypothetical protein